MLLIAINWKKINFFFILSQKDPEVKWGAIVDRVLKDTFKFDSFRPLQRDVVLSVLSGSIPISNLILHENSIKIFLKASTPLF